MPPTNTPEAPNQNPYPQQPMPQPTPTTNENPNKSYLVAAILTLFTGSLGIDRFYLGYTGLGIAKLLTAGGFGIWTIIDQFLIIFGKTGEKGNPARLSGYAEHSKIMKIVMLILLAFGVLIFIGVMAAVTITSYNDIQQKAKDSKQINAIYTKLEASYAEKGYYPTSSEYDARSFSTYTIEASATEGTTYTPIPDGCDNVATKCTAYSLVGANGRAYQSLGF